MGDAVVPDRELILEVMHACGCSDSQAINLLKHSNNDPEKAKHRHQTLMRFKKMPARPPVKSSTEVKTPSVKRKPIIEVTPVNHLEDSSDDEVRKATPRTEDEPPLRPNKHSQHLYTSHNPSRSSSRHSEFDRDRMDFQMDNHSSNPLPPIANPDYEIAYHIHHKSSRSSSLKQEYASVIRSPVELEAHLPPEPEEAKTWNFLLPELPPPLSFTPGQGPAGSKDINLLDLASAIQHGADEQAVQLFFENLDRKIIEKRINEVVAGFPSIFFAAATNNDRILRLWISHGADVNAVHPHSQTPLLAFAIVHSETIEHDTSHIVATLLSLGATPLAIPAAFYTPYFRDLAEDGPDDEELKEVGHTTMRWLDKNARAKLARTTHLTNRYNLERASKTKKPSTRHWQIAYRKNAEALLGLPFFLIGQSMAAESLLQKFLSYLVVPSNRPLVMVFAGLSGHGKTELARRLGYLMNLELEVVDCTIVSREMELFGGRHPYVNADQGTPLNNFLARHSGQRSIVFLDEFEKTTRDIHQALLLPFDNGEYQDRRNLKKIDCSKTIWILATNALDKKIKTFCQAHGQAIYDVENETQQTRLMKTLSKELKEEFLARFDAPVTGRISAFLPFLLFSPGEQAVIAHKYLLELGRDVRNPVNLSTGADERLIGNVRLRVQKDASVCRHLAEDGYHPDLGARSLITAVDSVKAALVEAYLGVDEAITEANSLVDFVVDVTGGEIVAKIAESPTPRMTS